METKQNAVFGENLIRKDVVSKDGKKLGSFYDASFVTKTGEIEYILVSPCESLRSTKFNRTRDNKLKIPSENVEAIENCVVVS